MLIYRMGAAEGGSGQSQPIGENQTQKTEPMKNKRNGFTIVEIIVCLQLLIVATIATAWCANLYKLTQCDFEAPYKGEIIHSIGILGPTSVVTVWFSDK